MCHLMQNTSQDFIKDPGAAAGDKRESIGRGIKSPKESWSQNEQPLETKSFYTKSPVNASSWMSRRNRSFSLTHHKTNIINQNQFGDSVKKVGLHRAKLKKNLLHI